MADVTNLAVRAGLGDGAALADFVKATIADLRRYCAAMVDDQSADDLVQQTYIKALRALSSYRGEAPAKAWLLGVARHACIDEIRQRKRRRAIEQTGVMIDPPLTHNPFEQLALQDLIASLESERREAFVLTQLLGFTYDEAAATMGCPVGTVRSRVYRARADLSTMLDSQPAALSPH